MARPMRHSTMRRYHNVKTHASPESWVKHLPVHSKSYRAMQAREVRGGESPAQLAVASSVSAILSRRFVRSNVIPPTTISID